MPEGELCTRGDPKAQIFSLSRLLASVLLSASYLSCEKPPAHDAIDVSAIDLPAIVGNGEIGKQTVAALKALCKREGLPVSGAKGKLVERLTEHVG